MTLDRRFGISLFVLALGNGMIAFGNYVAGGETYLIAFQALMGLVMATMGYTFVYGNSELTVDESRERLIAYTTVFIAAVGVVLAVAGFVIALSA